MPSSKTSSTQASDPTPSPSSTINNTPSNPINYRERSGQNILEELKEFESQDIYYAANTNLISQSEFVFNKELKGDMLVKKTPVGTNQEFVLAGIFEIDPRNFFMTSDGKWNPNNPLNTRLDQVKPTCHLLPVQRNPEFSFSSTDFSTIIHNLKAIENMANPRKSHDISSIIIDNPGETSTIKLTHHLFIDKKNPYDPENNKYTIDYWPVQPNNELYLEPLKSSHNVQQLPAYNTKGNLIHPSDYEEKLAGTIARVCFSIIHFNIKQKHVYNALVRDITVLRPPTTIARSSLTHILHPKN